MCPFDHIINDNQINIYVLMFLCMHLWIWTWMYVSIYLCACMCMNGVQGVGSASNQPGSASRKVKG